MSKDNKVEVITAVVVRLIMATISYGLFLWAAAETAGLLRWLLLGWVGFNVLVVFAATTVRQVKKDAA